MGDGSWIGLDVHARSVVAPVVDEVTGEVVVGRAPVGWMSSASMAGIESGRGSVADAFGCAERLKRRWRTGVVSSGNRPSVAATLSFEAFVSE